MIISKELKIVTEKEILEEVGKELNIKKSDLKRTYDLWIDYLRFIAEETDQCTIKLPHIGRLYVSNYRIKKYSKSSEEMKILEKKIKVLQELKEKYGRTGYDHTPILNLYGLSRLNLKKTDRSKGIYEKFSIDDIVDNQAIKFFNEDIEYSKHKNLIKYFARGND